MSTPRELLLTALEPEPGRRPAQGELSLALAGAELIDLLADEAAGLDAGAIVPGPWTEFADPLLDEAAASLVREPPYEPVADWLWRRGRGLAATYLAALEAEGQLTRQRRRLSFRTGPVVPAESAARRRAAERSAAGEPVLAALANLAGIGGGRARDRNRAADAGDGTGTGADAGTETGARVPAGLPDAAAAVLAAVDDAVAELAAVRQRRAVEQAAFDNIWRGDGF